MTVSWVIDLGLFLVDQLETSGREICGRLLTDCCLELGRLADWADELDHVGASVGSFVGESEAFSNRSVLDDVEDESKKMVGSVRVRVRSDSNDLLIGTSAVERSAAE